jgi:hypothetical protein
MQSLVESKKRTRSQSIQHASHLREQGSTRHLASDIIQRALEASHTLTPADVTALQHSVGNRAVQRILAGQGEPSGGVRAPVRQSIGVQRKGSLRVGAVESPSEREAGRVAAQVTDQVTQRAHTPSAQPQKIGNKSEASQTKPLAPALHALRRMAAGQGKFFLGDAATKSENLAPVQASSGPDGGVVGSGVEREIQRAGGGGHQLDDGVRGRMESALGADFGAVRIHTNTQADRLNRSLNSRAFAVGWDLFFKGGEYRPDTTPGQGLIAHELTHVAQQTGAGVGHGAAKAGAPANVIQRAIATAPATLTGAAPMGHALHAHFTQIAAWITQYNTVQANGALSQKNRLQQQLDLLRQIDRRAYQCMSLMSQNTLVLDQDPNAQLLHQLLTETQAEYEQIIDTITGSAYLRRRVNPLATGGITDMAGGDARDLWREIMTGQGKIKMVGDAAYNRKAKSWLTKLMDTQSGRQLLNKLDAGTLADFGTNIYLGQDQTQLPAGALAAADPGLNIPPVSKATPLRAAHASLDTDAGGGGRFHTANSAAGFKDAVMDRRYAGVRVGGQRYRFGAGTGAFVHVSPTEPTMPVQAGQERIGAAGLEVPQTYMPKWLVLGHELGHALNMRRGASTENMVNPAHSVFADQWSGKHGQELEDFWYHGSEEFLNITNIENAMRGDVGLDDRGSHSTPHGLMKVRRWRQLQVDLNYNAHKGYLAGVDANVQADLDTNGLESVQTHLRQQLNNNPRTPAFPALRAMAQRMNAFITAWQALEVAHGAAGKGKRFQYYGWWQKALSSLHNIGQVVINSDMVRYNRKLQRIRDLAQDYQ